MSGNGKTVALFLKPKPSRIIVQEDGFVYTGKIVIPEVAKRRPTTGRVVAVGSDITSCRVGERVVYGMYSGTLIEFKGQPAFRAMVESEILAEVTKDELELEGTGS